MNIKSKKFKGVVSHNESTPWWQEPISGLINSLGKMGETWVSGKFGQEIAESSPASNANTNTNTNAKTNTNANAGDDKTILYVGAGALVLIVLIVLLVVLLKK